MSETDKELVITRQNVSKLPLSKKLYNKMIKRKYRSEGCTYVKPVSINKPDQIRKLSTNLYVVKSHTGEAKIPIMPAVGFGEFYEILDNGIPWDNLNPWGVSMLAASISMGGRILCEQEISQDQCSNTLLESEYAMQSLINEEYKRWPNIYQINGKLQLKRKIKLKPDTYGLTKLRDLIGMSPDFCWIPDDQVVGDKFKDVTVMVAEEIVRNWSYPNDFAKTLATGVYTQYVVLNSPGCSKKDLVTRHNTFTGLFICPECGIVNSSYDPEVLMCGRCLKQGLQIKIDVSQVEYLDLALTEPSAYEYDYSINSQLTRLLTQNYTDGISMNLPESEEAQQKLDVLNYVKAKSRLDIKTQYVCSNLTSEELSYLKREFKTLEITPRTTWNDLYGLMQSECHCLATTVIQRNQEDNISIKGFSPSYVNSCRSSVTFVKPDVNTHWTEMGAIGGSDCDIYNFNSLPELETLIKLADVKSRYLIVPNIHDQHNGFTKNYSYEISKESGLVKILANGTTVVLNYRIEMLNTLLKGDILRCGSKLYRLECIKKTNTVTLVKISRISGKQTPISSDNIKAVRTNVYKTFILSLPDWQQNVKGIQFGPLIKRRVRFNLPFLAHLKSRCESWPVSYHGLREYAIVSSFSRVEKDDRNYNIFDVDFEDIPDHVFAAYNLYLREQISSQTVSWLNQERPLGLEGILQGTAGGVAGIVKNLVIDRDGRSYLNTIIEKGSDTNWFLSSQWEDIKRTLEKWEAVPISIVDMSSPIDSGEISQQSERCVHGSLIDHFPGGCVCCGAIRESGQYCETCRSDTNCKHRCFHSCKGWKDHLCTNINVGKTVTLKDKLPCGHTVTQCSCCGVLSCLEKCMNCFDWNSYTDDLDQAVVNLLKRSKSQPTEQSYAKIVKKARKDYDYMSEEEQEQPKETSKHGGKPDSTPWGARVKYRKPSLRKAPVQAQKVNLPSEHDKAQGIFEEYQPILTHDKAEEEKDPYSADFMDENKSPKHTSDEDETLRENKSESIVDEEQIEKENANVNEMLARAYCLSLTDETYTGLVVDPSATRYQDPNSDFFNINYCYTGDVIIDPDSIQSVAGIDYSYTPGFCLKDTLAYFNPGITEERWEEACLTIGSPLSWCDYNDIPRFADYFEMNIIYVHIINNSIIQVRCFCSDPTALFSCIKFSTGEIDVENYNLLGHFEPALIKFRKEPIVPPVYLDTLTREDVDELFYNVTGDNMLSNYLQKSTLERLTFCNAANKITRMTDISAEVPELKFKARNNGFTVSNNSRGLNDAKCGHINTHIPGELAGMNFSLPRIYNRYDLEQWYMENLIKEEELDDENKVFRQRLLILISQYLELMQSAKEVESNKKNMNNAVAFTLKGIRPRKKKKVMYIENLSITEKVKNGDLVTIRAGPNLNTVQVGKDIKKLVLPNVMKPGLEFKVDLTFYKISYTSLIIEMSSIINRQVSLARVKELLKNAICLVGYPGTGKTRTLIEMWKSRKGMLVGVTRGSQNSLRYEAGSSKEAYIMSAEKCSINNANSEIVYIDEATLLTLPRLCTMLGPRVNKLVLSGDLLQIPAKEFSQICGFETTNCLEYAMRYSKEITKLKETWRFGARLCEAINEAFDTEMVSKKTTDTPMHLEHLDGLTKVGLERIIEERGIDTVLVFTGETEKRIRNLIGESTGVKITRVHSSQGNSYKRGLVVQDFRNGPYRNSEEIQFKSEYMMVAMTRCELEVTLLCTYKACNCRENTITNLAKHMNRQLGIPTLMIGGDKPQSDLIKKISLLAETFMNKLSSLEPNVILDWFENIKSLIISRKVHHFIKSIQGMIANNDEAALFNLLSDLSFPLLESVQIENGKAFAILDYNKTNWGFFKKKIMQTAYKRQEITIINGEVNIGGITLVSEQSWTTVEINPKGFQAWEQTKMSKVHFKIQGFKSIINLNNTHTINMNIRLINHAAQLAWHGVKRYLCIKFNGMVFSISPTVGCSLCGGIEIRNAKKELIVFINNTYDDTSTREIQYKDESNPITQYLIELWKPERDDDTFWELTQLISPDVNLNLLHCLMWVERIGTGIRGLFKGKSINPDEGHLFRNDLENNEIVHTRYVKRAQSKGIKIIGINDPSNAYMKNLSFLWLAKHGATEQLVYFSRHKDVKVIPINTSPENNLQLLKTLWTQELMRLPYNLSVLTANTDFEILGIKEILNSLELDIEEHKRRNTKLVPLIDQELVSLLANRGITCPDLYIPQELFDDAKTLGIQPHFNLSTDSTVSCGGMSYITDSYFCKMFSLNTARVRKAFHSRFINISLRQDIEQHVKMIRASGPLMNLITSECEEDCFNRIKTKVRTLKELAANKSNEDKSRPDPKSIEALEKMLTDKKLDSLVEPSSKNYEVDILGFGMSFIELTMNEIRKIAHDRNAGSNFVLFLPDFRKESVRCSFKKKGDHIVGVGESLDYVINKEWIHLINGLFEHQPHEVWQLPDSVKVIGSGDLYLTITSKTNTRTGPNAKVMERISNMIPVNYRNDEMIAKVPRMNSIKAIKETGELFNSCEVVLDKDTVSRLVRRAMTPGCTLNTLQTIARNRMQSSVITKGGRRGAGRTDLLRDINLCALVAQYIANNNENQITKYMEKIDTFLMDNKDWKRSTGALYHMLKLEMNTIIGQALDIKIPMRDLSNVLGDLISVSLGGNTGLKSSTKIMVMPQPHRIIFGEYYFSGSRYKVDTYITTGLEVIGNIIRNTFGQIFKRPTIRNYWRKPAQTNVKEKLDELIESGDIHDFEIRVYDLSGGIFNMIDKTMKKKFNMNKVPHTSVVIDRAEISYGNGITVKSKSTKDPAGSYKSIPLKCPQISKSSIVAVLTKEQEYFNPTAYSPIGKNCNLFSTHLASEIGALDELLENSEEFNEIVEIVTTVSDMGKKLNDRIVNHILRADRNVNGSESLTKIIKKAFDIIKTKPRPKNVTELKDIIWLQYQLLNHDDDKTYYEAAMNQNISYSESDEDEDREEKEQFQRKEGRGQDKHGEPTTRDSCDQDTGATLVSTEQTRSHLAPESKEFSNIPETAEDRTRQLIAKFKKFEIINDDIIKLANKYREVASAGHIKENMNYPALIKLRNACWLLHCELRKDNILEQLRIEMDYEKHLDDTDKLYEVDSDQINDPNNVYFSISKLSRVVDNEVSKSIMDWMDTKEYKSNTIIKPPGYTNERIIHPIPPSLYKQFVEMQDKLTVLMNEWEKISIDGNLSEQSKGESMHRLVTTMENCLTSIDKNNIKPDTVTVVIHSSMIKTLYNEMISKKKPKDKGKHGLLMGKKHDIVSEENIRNSMIREGLYKHTSELDTRIDESLNSMVYHIKLDSYINGKEDLGIKSGIIKTTTENVKFDLLLQDVISKVRNRTRSRFLIQTVDLLNTKEGTNLNKLLLEGYMDPETGDKPEAGKSAEDLKDTGGTGVTQHQAEPSVMHIEEIDEQEEVFHDSRTEHLVAESTEQLEEFPFDASASSTLSEEKAGEVTEEKPSEKETEKEKMIPMVSTPEEIVNSICSKIGDTEKLGVKKELYSILCKCVTDLGLSMGDLMSVKETSETTINIKTIANNYLNDVDPTLQTEEANKFDFQVRMKHIKSGNIHEIGKELNGIKILLVAYGSAGDTIPIQSVAEKLKHLGAWICLITHPDNIKVNRNCYNKIMYFDISQQESTGNATYDSVEENARAHLKFNYETATVVNKAVNNYNFDIALTSPIVPATTAITVSAGIVTCEIFCTACWEVGGTVSTSLLNIPENDYEIVKSIANYINTYTAPVLWPAMRQTLADRTLNLMGKKSAVVTNVLRALVSSEYIHSDKVLDDPLTIVLGYASSYQPTLAMRTDYKLRIGFFFGSMRIRDKVQEDLITLISSLIAWEVSMLVHIQDCKINHEYRTKLSAIQGVDVLEGLINQTDYLVMCDAVFTHGGAGTVQEILRCGAVPFIYPLFADQPYIAENIEQKGLGFYVRRMDTSILHKLKHVNRYKKRILELKWGQKKVTQNLIQMVVDMMNNVKSKSIEHLQQDDQSVITEERLVIRDQEIFSPVSIRFEPGIFSTRGPCSEETVIKISDSYTGEDCLKQAFLNALVSMEPERLARGTYILRYHNIKLASDLPTLTFISYYTYCNIQLLGKVNQTVIFDKTWPLISIFITRPRLESGRHVAHAFGTDHRMDLVRKKHTMDSSISVLDKVDKLYLLQRTNHAYRGSLSDMLDTILYKTGSDDTQTWDKYGGYLNACSRMKCQNLDSIIESNQRLVIPVIKATRMRDGVWYKMQTVMNINIGDLALVCTVKGDVCGIIAGQRGEDVYVYTGLTLDALPVLICLRLLRTASQRVLELNLRNTIREVPQLYVAFNSTTLNLINQECPGAHVATWRPGLEERCKVLCSHFDTRPHHSDRSKLERKYLLENLGTNKLKLIPKELPIAKVRLVKESQKAYFNYADGVIQLSLEFRDARECEIAKMFTKLLVKARFTTMNQRKCLRIPVDDDLEITALMTVIEILYNVDETDLILKRSTTELPGQTKEISRTYLEENFKLPDNAVVETVLSTLFKNKPTLTATVMEPTEHAHTITNTLKLGIQLDPGHRWLVILSPFTVYYMTELKGGGIEIGSSIALPDLIEELEDGTGHSNLEPGDMMMDQNPSQVAGPKFGKETFNTFSKWIRQNKWTDFKLASAKNISKAELTKKKMVWEEMYHYVDMDGANVEIGGGEGADYLPLQNEIEIESAGYTRTIMNEDETINELENYQVMDLWKQNRDIIDHVVAHCPKNDQRYTVKDGFFSIQEVLKTTFSEYPERCRPVFHTEAYASLNSLTGRLGRSAVIRNFKTRPSVSQTIQSMSYLFFRKDWKESVENFKAEPIVYNEKDFRNWIYGHKNAHKVITELESLSAEGPLVNPFNFFRSHVKLESINKENPIMDFRQAAPRAIVWLPYCMPALFSYMFKMASNRFKLILRKEVHYASGLDVNDIEQIVRNTDDSDVFFFDNDISKMDSQIDKDLIEVEWEVLSLMGISPDVLESYKTLKRNWRISNKYISVTGKWLRHSGEPTTALGNGIINLAITALSTTETRRQDLKLCLFMGDDMVMLTKKKEDVLQVKKKGKHLANSLLKPRISRTCSPFCSFIVGVDETTQTVAIVPNVVRLAYKWEVPNGQHETTEDAVFTRQLSYACVLGRNDFSKDIEKKISVKTGGELEVPTYYTTQTMIKLNCDLHNMEEMQMVQIISKLYSSLQKPKTYSYTFLITSENLRKGIRLRKESDTLNTTESRIHHRLDEENH
ncbi:polyprotein [Lily alphaendornavirus]|nr:polyprotein [Lily alphaendornavirus]